MSTLAPTRYESEQNPGLVAIYGFVPNLFRAQRELPRAVGAQEGLLGATLLGEKRLARHRKNEVLRGVAGVWQNEYCLALHGQLPAAEDSESRCLLNFALKLARYGPWVSAKDVTELSKAGFNDSTILELVVTTALGQMLCSLAEGLQPTCDPDSSPLMAAKIEEPPQPSGWIESAGPYLRTQADLPAEFDPYSALREQIGFVPNLFRAQALLPEILQAEVGALEHILFPDDALSRIQKETIALVISSANLNTYCVALQSQVMSALGVPEEDCDSIISDYQTAPIPLADKTLMDEAIKLSRSPIHKEKRFDAEALRKHGFTEPQIVEAIVTAGLTNFLNTLQFGLGAVPDFPPRRIFTPKDLYPVSPGSRPTFEASPAVDPDAELVAKVRSGDADGFEELVRRHSRRVFSTVAGMVGNVDDARDATQDVFLKAFEKIGQFEGRSKFSTWLLSIAINTGTEMLRRCNPAEPLGEAEDDDFRPRQVQSWEEDPEQRFSAAQRSELVRDGILRLPEKYRAALILRDINQLSTEEAAATLDLSVPALKARVLRGRLMLRERLAPHFIRTEKDPADA